MPNFITLLSLSCGFTSIRFSLNGELEIAIYLILLATIFDFFDGWFARKLKTGSNFGAELDSLSDFVSFGVAPSFLIYLWSTHTLGSLGWGATLFFVICSALRLARFTADIYITVRSPKEIYKSNRSFQLRNGETTHGGSINVPADKYFRETFFASVHTRNLATPQVPISEDGRTASEGAGYNE